MNDHGPRIHYSSFAEGHVSPCNRLQELLFSKRNTLQAGTTTLEISLKKKTSNFKNSHTFKRKEKN
jgi:hypothetical protein